MLNEGRIVVTLDGENKHFDFKNADRDRIYKAISFVENKIREFHKIYSILEEFSDMGSKSWGVSEEGFFFDGQCYPFHQISKISLISTPGTPLTNGIANLEINGKVMTLASSYSDRQRAKLNFLSYFF